MIPVFFSKQIVLCAFKKILKNLLRIKIRKFVFFIYFTSKQIYKKTIVWDLKFQIKYFFEWYDMEWHTTLFRTERNIIRFIYVFLMLLLNLFIFVSYVYNFICRFPFKNFDCYPFCFIFFFKLACCEEYK